MLALALWSLWFKKPAPIKKEPQSAREWLTEYRKTQNIVYEIYHDDEEYHGLILMKKSA